MYSIVITTCATPDDAKQIASGLLAEQLAACIQTLPIHSHYRWKGKIEEESEVLLLIKAKSSLYAQIEASIRRSHKYETPEIVQIPITAGSAAYLKWIDEVSK